MTRTRSVELCLCLLGLYACSADGGSATRPSGPGRPSIPNANASGNAGAGGDSSIPGASGGRSAPPALAGGGAPTTVGDSCAAISQTADNRLQPADIIIAVDNSGSMDEEIVFVREQLNAFSQQIVDSGVDVRIILISAPVAGTMPAQPPPIIWDDDDDQDNGICIGAPLGSGSCPADSNPPRYVHVAREVKSHDALNLFISTFSQWRDQLRSNATKTFVVVTDDNAEDEPNDSAGAFTQNVAALDPVSFAKWSLSGIYCFTECPDAAEIGTVYADLVKQTSGVGGDLCLQDFAPVFDALARQVVGNSKLDCAWEIPPAPAGQMFRKDFVNVEFTASGGAPELIFHVDAPAACGAQGGWHYDSNDNPSRVLACPSTCERLQADGSAKIDVLFGCQTKDGPD